MKVTSFKTWLVVLGCALLSAPAYALSLTDAGVVGAASGETADNANVGTATAIAQHLLDMAAGTKDAAGCSLTGTAPCYNTSTTEYAGAPTNVLTGGVRIDGNTAGSPDIHDISNYTWALGKYDGPNGGYILFHVPTYIATFGDLIPDKSDPLWTNNQGNGYGLSGFTGWGGTSVPDGGSTLVLLGAALSGLGFARRFMNG